MKNFNNLIRSLNILKKSLKNNQKQFILGNIARYPTNHPSDCVNLQQKKIINNQLFIVWFNRLSDYLYLMARFEELAQKKRK